MNFITNAFTILRTKFTDYPSQIDVHLDNTYKPANSVLSVQRINVAQFTRSNTADILPLYWEIKENTSFKMLFFSNSNFN